MICRLIILQPSRMNDPSLQSFSNPLDTQTVLILFVQIVIVVIYLISLLLVIMRRLKKLIEMHNRKYYLIIVFYIASKLILCIILVVQIIVGMTNQWADIDPGKVETFVKIAILMADLSIIQLFLVALETYLQYCFSVGADAFTKKRSKLLNNGLRGLQITVALMLIIPFVLYVAGITSYEVINVIEICLNLLVIISFLVTFFYLNFKMTGLMMDNRLNEVIKRIYKVQLIILVSRACALTFQILVALYVPTTFQDYINSTSIKYEIVLAMVFVGSVLFILFTQGLPVMYSLRSAVVHALNHKMEASQINRSQEQSIVDKFQDAFEPAPRSYKEVKLKDFLNIRELRAGKADSIWITKIGNLEGKDYLVRISKHQISSYIFEDIENEITQWAQLNLRHLSKLNYFCEEDIVHLFQRYYEVDLDMKVADIQRESECLKLALSIAEGIQELHNNDIVHGSLSPQYIFFNDNQVIFTGLGLHSLKKYLSLITGYTNKNIYTAIQHLKDKNNIILKPKKSADIYSFGIILYEMVTRNKHYRQLQLRDIQTKFVEECFRPKLPQDIKYQLKNLIRKCWNEISERRPNIDQVIDSLRRMTS